MPEFSFEHIVTKEVVTVTMKNEERIKFLEENTNWFQILTKFNLGDSVKLGVTKPPTDFNHVLRHIKKNNGGVKSTVGDNSRWDINR